MEELVLCVDCNEEIEIDDAIIIDDEYYCQDCVDENYFHCEECGEMHHNDDGVWIENEEIMVCDECLSDNFFRCDYCEEYERNYERIVTHDGGEICQYCYENNFFTCESCEEVFHNDEMCSDDWSCYCSTCHDENNVIKDYYYKPNPIFFGHSIENLYLGVELEIDDGGDRGNVAVQLSDFDEIYCKSDGSLDDGVEIVTHPCTLDYHLNNLGWETVIEEARKESFKSHNTSTCGLHVHLSKKACGNNREEVENTVAKMISFTEKNWKEVLKFSRRSQSKMDEWAKRYLTDSNTNNVSDIEDVKSLVYGGSARYRTINVRNSETIEIRFFRGTLIKESLFASLEFSVALLEIAKNNSLSDILNKNFTDYMDVFNSYKYITPYMIKRGIINE